MEAVLEEINKKLDKIDEREERMERKIDIINVELNKIKKENEQLKRNNQKLMVKIEQQEMRMEEMEKEMRKKNIIIHGVEEIKEESELQLKERMRLVLRDIDIPIVIEEELTDIRRVGKPQAGIKTRPILIELKNWTKKLEILKAASKLRGTKIYIEQDYSKATQGIRRELREHMKTIRQKGHHAIIRNNNLIINGDEYTLQQLKTVNITDEDANTTEYNQESATEMKLQRSQTAMQNQMEQYSKKGRTVGQRSPGENEEEKLRGKLLKTTKTSETKN